MKKIGKTARDCTDTTKTGAKCRAKAVLGSNKCFVHDAALENKRTAARRTGGEHNRQRAVLGPDAPPISLRSGGDAVEIAGRLVDWLLRSEIDTKIANAVCLSLNFFLRAHQVESLEQRIAALEATRSTRPQRPPERLEGVQRFGRREAKS
jgi:hypothetical protein